MKTSKVLLLLACAVMGAGLYADDAKTPERPGKGFRKMGQRPDMVKILNLNDAEKKSMEEADAVSALLQQTMEQIVSLDVPLVAEVSRGKDWDAAH